MATRSSSSATLQVLCDALHSPDIEKEELDLAKKATPADADSLHYLPLVKERPPLVARHSSASTVSPGPTDEPAVPGADDATLPGEVGDEEKYDYPDGGLEAWTVVAGAFSTVLVVFGTMASFGAFLSHYSSHQLKTSTPQAIAGIGSVQGAVAQLLTLLTGPFFDRYGPRPCMLIGSSLFLAGLLSTSFCTELWQFYLVQGIIQGVGMAFLFLAPLACVAQFFDRKRGIAIGICVSGPSVGAIITPLLMAQLPAKIGFGWSVRVIALYSALLLGFATWALKTRLPQKRRKRLLNPRAFLHGDYSAIAAASCCFTFGSFFSIYFIQTYARAKGFTAFAPYTLIIINGCSGLGRIIIGLCSDHLGRFNLASIAMFIASVTMFSWMACETIGSIVAFCIIYGVSSAGFASLQITCISFVCLDPQELGTNIGQVVALCGLFLIGAPLSGLFLGSDESSRIKNFPRAIALNASMLLATSALFFVARMLVWRQGGRRTWRV